MEKGEKQGEGEKGWEEKGQTREILKTNKTRSTHRAQTSLAEADHPSNQSTSADVSLTSVQRQFNMELTLN